MQQKSVHSLLIALLTSLADFDGQISDQAIALLDALRVRSSPIPPLYADVFGLPASATCADLVQHVESLSEAQVATASYAFQIFRPYEQLLRVDTTSLLPQRQAASESQLERVRQQIIRANSAIAELIGNGHEE